ncbi:MAG: hypothetical protein WC903_08620 [Candidatus Margulisiibacteriota bacterium]
MNIRGNTGLISAIALLCAINMPSPSFAIDQAPYGAFKSKAGDIRDAIKEYENDSKSKLIDISLNAEIPSTMYAGDKYVIKVHIIGNYDNNESHDINANTVMAFPGFAQEKSNVINLNEYNYYAPTTEGEYKVNINASYQDKQISKTYVINVINNADEYISALNVYGGNLSLFGVEGLLAGGRVNSFLDGVFYATAYTRKRNIGSDSYIVGGEGGTKFLSKRIFNQVYVYGGLGIGFDVYSSGGPGFMFGPTDSITNIYLDPSVGLIINVRYFCVFTEAKANIYNGDSIGMIRFGLGI